MRPTNENKTLANFGKNPKQDETEIKIERNKLGRNIYPVTSFIN